MANESVVSAISKVAVGSEISNRATGLLSQAMALIEPNFSELCRTQRIFGGGMAAVSVAVVPVVDLPTTTAPVVLHNSASDGGRCIVPLALTWSYGSGTAGAYGMSIFAGVTASKTASPPTAHTANYTSQCLRGTGTSIGLFKPAVTIPAGTSWVLLDGIAHGAATTTGIGKGVRLDGMFVVPPGFSFCTGVYADTGTTAKYILSIIWAELELDLP